MILSTSIFTKQVCFLQLNTSRNSIPVFSKPFIHFKVWRTLWTQFSACCLFHKVVLVCHINVELFLNFLSYFLINKFFFFYLILSICHPIVLRFHFIIFHFHTVAFHHLQLIRFDKH
uniref:Uncharacterized protein n=1 Tax=Cacopsylla melanoneura TaxID=428564 RepID=A0A8D8SQ13_9HEMI